MNLMKSIYIVDDDLEFCEQICDYFAQNGFRAQAETNPNDALIYLKENPFEILITDFYMSPIDGLEFIRRLREFNTTTKILLISAYFTLDQEIVAALKIMGYLHKPLDLALIVKRLKELN